jgi:excisionase family DNA binding protein
MLTPEIEAAIERAVAKRLPPLRESYLKIREAAAILHVHPDTISRLIHSGELGCVGAGKLTRIPNSAIATYLETNSTAAKVAAHRS